MKPAIPRTNARGLLVGILGGSITGCAMAAELARVGCVVTVLESGGVEPKDRGDGIGLPPSLVRKLVLRDLVDPDMPTIPAHHFPRIVKDERKERFGQVLWDQQGSIQLLNWGVLHRNLRRRVPEGAYRTSSRVTKIRDGGDGVHVELADGTPMDFDLLVCADGYRSLGRRTIFPDVPVDYAGYVLWRGALEERAVSDTTPLEDAMAWPSYLGGHGPFFLVPGRDGALERGKRLINWALYLRVTEIERAELLTGKDPAVYAGPLPLARETRLKSWVRDVLPDYYAEIVEKTASTAVQAIYESAVPAYRKGHIALAGDAGALARPHTGTGVLKGITNAIALGEALAAHPSVEDALTLWSDEQTAFGNELVQLGSQIGRALAEQVPAAPSADAAAMQKWFSSIVTVPTEVFSA